jgi:hypothetical protein
MSRSRLLVALPLLAVASAPLAADPARPEGRIDAGDGQAELLPRPMPAGTRIELEEGWLRIEEDGAEDQGVGSFTIAAALPLPEATGALPAHVTAAPAPEPQVSPSTAGAAPEPCRAQRAAYLRELWRTQGIEVEDPIALLEGLQAGASGPAAGFYWFALAADPFRPLAWSSELQSRARDLGRCVRENPPHGP